MKYYAGIGSRKTPTSVLEFMTQAAASLEKKGFILRSGGAAGADSAFEAGCTNKDIYLPWPSSAHGRNGIVLGTHPEAVRIAKMYHPAWERLGQAAQKLMARNVGQIIGNPYNPILSSFVLCWTPDGAEKSTTIATGGTGQAIRMAIAYNVPVFNLANDNCVGRLKAYLETLEVK